MEQPFEVFRIFLIFQMERNGTVKMEWNGTERNETAITNVPFSVVSKTERNGTKRNGTKWNRTELQLEVFRFLDFQSGTEQN